jgi:hypothetical protein
MSNGIELMRRKNPPMVLHPAAWQSALACWQTHNFASSLHSEFAFSNV